MNVIKYFHEVSSFLSFYLFIFEIVNGFINNFYGDIEIYKETKLRKS